MPPARHLTAPPVAAAPAQDDRDHLTADARCILIVDDDESLQGATAATYQLGYGIAVRLVAGAGALYIAEYGSWPIAYQSMAACALVGIVTTLIKGDVFNWGQIMAGELLGAAPPLIIYAFLMDYYIAGLTAGATKG